MATAARHNFAVWRNDDVFEYAIRVRGVDLTESALAMEARLKPDTPGTPEFALAKVTNGNAEGLRVAGVTTEDGMPVSDLRIRLNKSTRQALPYQGEMGQSSTVSYALLIDGITRLFGEIEILAHAYGSTDAPFNRPGDFASARTGVPRAGASMTIANGEIVALTIEGAELLGPIAAKSQEALDQIENFTKGDQGEPGTWGDTAALSDSPTDIAGLKLFGFNGADPVVQYGIPASRLILADANGNLAIGTETATNGLAEIKTTAVGAPSTRGLVVSHNADGVGSYGIDVRAYAGASTPFVLHGYSGFLEDGPNCGVVMQIDHTKSGAHLILKNDENPETSPDTRGTASFLTLTGYGGASGNTRNTVFVEWTHQNRMLLQDVHHPLEFFGAGVVVNGTTATLGSALTVNAAKLGQYATNISGKDNGLQIVTDTDGNNTLNIVKGGASDGNVIRVINAGFGPMLKLDDGFGAQKAAIAANGDYYVGTQKVLGARGAAVADATDAESVITQLNALLARLRTHGLIAP